MIHSAHSETRWSKHSPLDSNSTRASSASNIEAREWMAAASFCKICLVKSWSNSSALPHTRMQHLNTPSLLIRRIIQILLGQSRRNSWRSHFSGVPCRDDWLRISTDVSFRINCSWPVWKVDIWRINTWSLHSWCFIDQFSKYCFPLSCFQCILLNEMKATFGQGVNSMNSWSILFMQFPRVPSYKIIATIQQVTIMW